MRNVSLLAALVLTLATAGKPATAAPERYVFDTAHTNILFFVSHLGFSRMQGEFKKFDGGFTFDPDTVENSSVAVTIQTASIDTDHDGLNTHLRNADFFDVETFPTMTFTSTEIERTGDNTGRVTGDLTILGVTKPVTLDVTFNKAGTHPINKKWVAGFSATGTVQRSDFGMNYGVPNIGDEVQVVLEVEGFRQ